MEEYMYENMVDSDDNVTWTCGKRNKISTFELDSRPAYPDLHSSFIRSHMLCESYGSTTLSPNKPSLTPYVPRP